MQTEIAAELEASTVDHQADLERERERAERLMAALLRAKADVLAARTTVARLKLEVAALRWRPWSHWLTCCKRQRNTGSAASSFSRGDLIPTYTMSLALLLLVVATAALLTVTLNAPYNKTTVSLATVTQEVRPPGNTEDVNLSVPPKRVAGRATASAATAAEVRMPVDIGEVKLATAANDSQTETTESTPTAGQEMRAPVDDATLNVSHDEMITSSPPLDVDQQESAPQQVDRPRPMASSPALAEPPAAAKAVSKKPPAEKTAVKRPAVVVRQHSTATRERGSVPVSVGPHTGYATDF